MLSAVVVVTFSLLVGGAFLLLVLQSSLMSTAWSKSLLSAPPMSAAFSTRQAFGKNPIHRWPRIAAAVSRFRSSTGPITLLRGASGDCAAIRFRR